MMTGAQIKLSQVPLGSRDAVDIPQVPIYGETLRLEAQGLVDLALVDADARDEARIMFRWTSGRLSSVGRDC